MSELIDISIVIPAYNEAKRLPSFLESLIRFCKNNGRRFEIIVVDDGSVDDTHEQAAKFISVFSRLSIIRLNKNMGKGYAVKCGLMGTKGTIALFIDADGSITPNEIEKNIHYLHEGYDIVVGSRVLQGEGKIVEARLHRKIIGKCFNFFVHSFLFKEIQDTQCGFKLFKREVIRPLFARMYLNKFGFDIELLYLANKMGYKIKEVPITWKHKIGSKVNLLTDSVSMFFNILEVRNWHCTPISLINSFLGPDEYRYMFNMEKNHWWFVSRQRLVVNLIKKMHKKRHLILDAGCGTGNTMMILQEFGMCFGFDASAQALVFCKKNALKNTVQSKAEDISFKSDTFDLIICMDVLEHIDHVVHALSEVKRVLKEKGKIIFTVPALRLLWSQHDDALGHLRRFEKRDFIDTLTQAGLHVEKCGYFFFTSFFVVAPIRIMRRFFVNRIKIKSDTTTLPPHLLNEFLKLLFRLEIKISQFVPLPIGTTLYAVISKK